MKKLTTIFAVPAPSLSLAACGDTADDAPAETAAAPETVTEQAAETTAAVADDDDDDDDRDDQADDRDDQADDQPQAAGSAQGELPGEVSGYTGEAEAEMAEEGVSEDDVQRVLAAANNNEAGVEIEWDDDGYWEIELGDIDIDIDPDGLVREVGRDD